MRVMSCNIKYDDPRDLMRPWSKRKEVLGRLIARHVPHILATQEGRRPQIETVVALLPKLTLADRHRQWIAERMYPCIFYDASKFEFLESGDIWLSETPTMPGSKSFGSTFPRLASWVLLRFLKERSTLLVVNCHLDHVLPSTRLAQIKVLCAEVEKYNRAEHPLLLLGDFNDAPDSLVRRELLTHFPLLDPWKVLNKKEDSSFHDCAGRVSKRRGARIDWILADQKFLVQAIEFLKESEEGLYPSDHFPVLASFALAHHCA